MTIENIDLNKLQSYSGKTTQSFEQFIYCLMNTEYGHLGKFTPIDGAGGDTGVEFYLDLPSGERWGWQCKWYPDNGRLSQSGRKTAIEKSLETTCANHDNLTKWFLCLRNDLTKGTAGRDGEREWFDHKLPLKVPVGKSVELEFVGESEIVRLLSKPKNIGVRNFFFGDLEFNQDWFMRKFTDSFEEVKDKYEPELHTMDKYTQSIIDFNLVNPAYKLILDSFTRNLHEIENEIGKELLKYQNEVVYTTKDQRLKSKCLAQFKKYEEHKSTAFAMLKDLEHFFSDYDIRALATLDYKSTYDTFLDYLEELSKLAHHGNGSIQRQAERVYYAIKDFFEAHQRFTRNYTHSIDSEIHFIAGPADGKTHTVCDIAYKRIQYDQPAIFLTGNKFNHETDVEQTILKRLDIPSSYSFEDFLSALDWYGSIAKVRIPIIIDGLNETINNKLFSDIWRTHLPSLITKIKRFDNLILITTCRNSYKTEIWDDDRRPTFQYLKGFAGYEVTKEAIEKYFNRYHIKTDLNFSNLNSFEKPIFLKLFCEIKNPQWQQGTEVEVILDDDSSDALFEKYFKQINTVIAPKSHLIRRGEPFIENNLAKIAKYLWDNKTREIEVNEFYKLIDGSDSYNAENSKADILINEGLIITRDNRDGNEYITITYELMSGYLIAKYLIQNFGLEDFKPEQIFHQKIANGDDRHPLYENILGELALLFPKHHKMMLHDIYSETHDRYIHSISIYSLWKLPAKCIAQNDVELVQGYFRSSDANRKPIIDLCFDTATSITHPFNAHFLSDQLLALNTWERDLSWTEYVRESEYQLSSYIEEFEKQCKTGSFESELSLAKIHLAAEHIHWILTSTNRKLRDYTTRALYYYGRRFPGNFIEIVFRSLLCDDPYLWERMLAALYGVCMATHHSIDFQQQILPDIAQRLYKAIFATEAPHSTTHILAKDYARGCIRLALIHHPKILDESQINLITPPYHISTPQLPMVDDDDDDGLTYKAPLGMDFSNYTIGYIVKDGHSYDNPPEKKIVRRQILHRIENLGWIEDRFKAIDDSIGRNHSNRHERPAIERYGKKYAWIAYYELAGYRADLGLLENEHSFRVLASDIDPSFPEDVETPKLIKTDLLADRSISLEKWLKTDDFPHIEEYIEPKLDDGKRYVCVDGFIKQSNEHIGRERFVFIRSFLVAEDRYADFLTLLEKQKLEGRWLPEKYDNTETFAGEHYIFDDATISNKTTMEFVLSRRKKTVKPGEEGYHSEVKVVTNEDGSISIKHVDPETRVITVAEKAEFEVLMPVATYHAPSDNREINKASSTTVLAKEIAMGLELIEKAQTFDLFDKNGEFACRNFSYHEDDTDSENLVYLRKDLLDHFLREKKLTLVWAIWGERSPSIGYFKAMEIKGGNHTINKYFVFQKIIEYPTQ